jgi:NRAMP (natural resistance-associated macrophage protein) metal ion transporters
MDPGNWATDIEGGSRYGYKLLWILLLSNLIALLLQSLSARLGIVRGKDLAQASREIYPQIINIPLWVLAEIAIAACDLAEVLGMAIGLKLLLGMPLLWGVSLAVLDTFIILLLQSKGMRYMEAFILSLLSIIGVSIFIELFFARPHLGELSEGFIPSSLSGDALYIAIGIIGATVMPHNLYLHSSLVQTRRTLSGEEGLRQAIRFNLIDSALALNMAFFVNASILILAATVFYKSGLHEVVTIEGAHAMLEPLLGKKPAPVLFAVALIAAGQSSTITGTLAGQIVMEGYLDLRITPWLRRLVTRLIAVIPAFLVIYISGENQVDDMLVLSQVILSLQLGFAIIPLIQLVSDKRKMGVFVIGNWLKAVAWLCAIVIITLNLKLVFEQVVSWRKDLAVSPVVIYLVIVPVVLLALLLLAVVIYYAIAGKTKETYSANTPHGMAQSIPVIHHKVYNTIVICVDFSGNDVRL